MAWVSTRQAAEVLGMSDRTVRAKCASGELRSKRFGKLWRVWDDDLKERPAEVVEDEAGQSETVLVSSTIGGNYTWNQGN